MPTKFGKLVISAFIIGIVGCAFVGKRIPMIPETGERDIGWNYPTLVFLALVAIAVIAVLLFFLFPDRMVIEGDEKSSTDPTFEGTTN